MKRAAPGVSFIEIIFVVLLLGILAAVAVPRLQRGGVNKQTAKTFSRQIAADLRYTRQLALTNAAANPQGFELVMTGSPPYSGYEIRSRQTASVVHSYPISPTIQCTGGDTFSFGPLGNLLTGSDTAVQIEAGEDRYTVSVISATGSVLWQED